MKTIIAEKPSVAREIARIVGAGKREEGYLTGNGYNVTWAFGHLVQPAMPEEPFCRICHLMVLSLTRIYCRDYNPIR